MKIRTGFVSNSSSSSFCILGHYVSESNLKSLGDDYEDKAYKNGLNVQRASQHEDDVVIGYSIEKLEKDYESKTIKEIKEEITEKVKRVFGVEPHVGFIHDGWYNG